MYIILKDSDTAKEKIQQIAALDSTAQVTKTTYNFILRTDKTVLSVVQFPERRVKVWKAGEPNKPIYISFKDLVSIQDL